MPTASLALCAAAWTVLVIDPYCAEKHLPDTKPADGRETTSLAVAAARGEFESVSFMIRPGRDMRRVDFAPTELKGPAGAAIPASAFDVYAVKVVNKWTWSWITYYAGNPDSPTPVPDMLVHDDALIRTDWSNHVNYVRADYPSGPVYLNMSAPDLTADFNTHLQPVRDAETFVPLDLKANEYRQIWITLNVPATAAPGGYTGKIQLREEEADAGALDFTLTVYPFELPLPRTHHDSSRRYLCALMHSPSLGEFLTQSKNLAVSEEKVRNLAKLLADHNILETCGLGEFTDLTTDDLSVRTIYLLREGGMPLDVVYDGMGYSEWLHAKDEKNNLVGFPDRDPAGYEKSLSVFSGYVDKRLEAFRKYSPHTEVYFMGSDEGSTWTQRRQFPYWTILKEKGAKLFVTCPDGTARGAAWIVDAAGIAQRLSAASAEAWHGSGARALTYATPFLGPECPDIWRRTRGIRFWFAEYDGMNDFAFYSGPNRWNETGRSAGGYRQAGIVFPTIDGAVNTIAFEALREGIDDIRYFSLHRLLAEKAIQSSDLAARALGRAELVWMEATDPEKTLDLDKFRAEVARRIVNLQETVGPIPPDPRPPPMPPLPPCTYGQNDSAAADPAALAEERVKADRYELAFPLFAKARHDASRPLDARIALAIRESQLLCSVLMRDRAVEAIDEALAWGGLARKEHAGERAKLLIAKFDALLAEEAYLEVFSPERLDRAREVYDATQGLPGITTGARNRLLSRLLGHATRSGRAEQTLTTVRAVLARQGSTMKDVSWLFIHAADACAALKDDTNALAWAERALKEGCGYPPDRQRMLRVSAWAAEGLGEWRKAYMAYADILSTIDEDNQGAEFKRVKNRLQAISEKMGAAGGKLDGLSPNGVDGGMLPDGELGELSLD